VKPDSRTIAAGTDAYLNPHKLSAIELSISHVVSSALLDDFLGDFTFRDVDQALVICPLLIDHNPLQALQVPTQEGREVYRSHERLHITPRLGKVKLANLSAEVIKTFRDELLANLSRPLARKVLVSLRTMLKTNDY